MYYKYDEKNGIHVPEPFKRVMTPMFMGDDDKIKESNFSVHFTEWEPGCEIDSHSHEIGMEAMYCMEGRGVAQVDGKEYPFVPGSMIVAPPGIQHKIKNTGDQLLRVFCIFSPPVTGESLRQRALEAVEAAKK